MTILHNIIFLIIFIIITYFNSGVFSSPLLHNVFQISPKNTINTNNMIHNHKMIPTSQEQTAMTTTDT